MFIELSNVIGTYGNFVKFGGGFALHHNKAMSANTLYVVMSSSLPFLNLDHETPLHTIGNAIGYVIFWPWNLTCFSM